MLVLSSTQVGLLVASHRPSNPAAAMPKVSTGKHEVVRQAFHALASAWLPGCLVRELSRSFAGRCRADGGLPAGAETRWRSWLLQPRPQQAPRPQQGAPAAATAAEGSSNQLPAPLDHRSVTEGEGQRGGAHER